MSWVTVEGWTAGQAWVDAKGKRTFYIRQRRGARRYHVSTKARTLRGAMLELERFERDPDGYVPAGSAEKLELTPALIASYVAWCRERGGDPRWLRAKELHLGRWAEALKGRDLARVTLGQLLDAMAGQPDRAKRIVAIKHLYSFLRQTDRIDTADDPTLDKLPVPQARVAQDAGGSKVIPEADFRAVLPHLPQRVADACRIMAATGCHLSEVIRFGTSGTVEGEVLGFAHKGGHVHRVAVSPAIAEAARRVRAWGAPSRETFYRAIRHGCRVAGVEVWTPGRFRHTFATRAVEAGVQAPAVAQALGHRSPATTLRWYSTTAVAPRVGGGLE